MKVIGTEFWHAEENNIYFKILFEEGTRVPMKYPRIHISFHGRKAIRWAIYGYRLDDLRNRKPYVVKRTKSIDKIENLDQIFKETVEFFKNYK